MTTSPSDGQADPLPGYLMQATSGEEKYQQEKYKRYNHKKDRSEIVLQRRASIVEFRDNCASSDGNSTYSEEEAVFKQLVKEQAMNQRLRNPRQSWHTGWWNRHNPSKHVGRSKRHRSAKDHLRRPDHRRERVIWNHLDSGYTLSWFINVVLGNVYKMARSFIIKTVSLRLFSQLLFIGIVLVGFIYATRAINRESWVHEASDGRAMITEHPTTAEIEDTWRLWHSPVSLESKISWVSRLRDKIGLSAMRPLNHWTPLRTGQLESHKNRIQHVEDPIHSVKELESRIDLIQRTIQGLDNANEFLRKEVDSKFDMISQRVLGVEHRLSEVSEEVASMKEYIADGQWIDDILKVLFDDVPKYVAMPRDPMANKIRIPKVLWDRVREVLIANDQIELSEDEVLSDSHQNPSSQQYNWMNFLNENERALHNIVDGRIIMISRNEFLNLVKAEADAIWASIEKKVVGLLEQDGTFEETDTAFNPLPNHSKRISKVEQQVISELIDEALARHSADMIAKPDYGLFSAGGQVIQGLTSPDYQPPEKPTGWGRLGLAYLFSPPRRQFEPRAVKAIQPDTHAGECWAMDGTRGQIGIRLARRITVTEVTIEHADPRVVFDPRSAPRELEIWRLVAPLDPTQQRFFVNRDDSIVSLDQGGEQHQGDAEGKPNGSPRRQSPVMGTWWKEGSPWPGATLLTTIEYRIQEGADSQQQRQETGTPANSDNSFNPVVKRRRPELAQTFSIPLSKQNVPSYGVVVRINSNWGQPDYTCLYRVRIHGYES